MFTRNALAAILVAGGSLLAAGGLSIAIAADDTTTAAPPAHGQHMPHFFKELGLTAAQQASVKNIMTAAEPQMKSLHQQTEANHQKLMQTKPDDPNYSNVVAEVAQSNAALESQRTTEHAQLRTQLYAVLTAAQKTQLATLEAAWAAEPHHWGDRGPPPPPAD